MLRRLAKAKPPNANSGTTAKRTNRWLEHGMRSYRKKAEWAYKPGSVENDHFSGMPIARHLKQPTRRSDGADAP